MFRPSLTWITLAQKVRSQNTRMDGGLFFLGASRLCANN